MHVLPISGIDRLFDALRNKGYRVVGPTVHDGAILYHELESAAELPAGWSDEQDGGKYRLTKNGSEALFAFASSPHSWKKYLHPPVQTLWAAVRENGTMRIEPAAQEPVKLAFIGVRACDLHAIAIQGRVFLGGPQRDTGYEARRGNTFFVAVNCSKPGGTCFCASMNRGPRASSGFDVALTEVMEEGRHYFVVEAGTARGQEMIEALAAAAATDAERAAADAISTAAAASMGRSMNTAGIKELLYANYDNSSWDHVAARCLSCGNCTLVCPTCFCTSVEDRVDLSGARAVRTQKWDSCFTTQFSYIHGGSIRPSTRSRYRQWLTHKLATWVDQFGESGCVGCGRCITWCPVAIDITEEVQAIRDRDLRKHTKGHHGNTRAHTA